MPLTRVSKTITKIGEIIVAHCQPARVDAAIRATPNHSTISPK